MAFYSRVKLPPLKLRQGSTASKALLFRGSNISGGEPSSCLGEDDDIDTEGADPASSIDDMDLLANEPTHHELHCKASVKGWSEHRKRLLSVLTECAAMPLGQLCVLCPNNALYRCQECGPLNFYCKECFCTQHKLANYFHVAEKWEVGIDRSDNIIVTTTQCHAG